MKKFEDDACGFMGINRQEKDMFTTTEPQVMPEGTTPSTNATTNLDEKTGTVDTTPIPEDPAASCDGGHTTKPSGG